MKHAGPLMPNERMIERQISDADVHEVLQRPESLEHGDRPELINCGQRFVDERSALPSML